MHIANVCIIAAQLDWVHPTSPEQGNPYTVETQEAGSVCLCNPCVSAVESTTETSEQHTTHIGDSETPPSAPPEGTHATAARR